MKAFYKMTLIIDAYIILLFLFVILICKDICMVISFLLYSFTPFLKRSQIQNAIKNQTKIRPSIVKKQIVKLKVFHDLKIVEIMNVGK